MASKGLTPKQKRFCEEYVIDFNATQAAIRVGYSAKTANEQAARMLANVSISEYIAQLQLQMKERSGVDADDVVGELAVCAFANIQDFFDDKNRFLGISKINRRSAGAIKSIKITEHKGKRGATKVTTEFTLHDKPGTLQQLGKHLGIFKEDNSQKKLEMPDIIMPGGD